MTKVKTALVGYGHLGKWHAQKCQSLESCDFLYIVEPNIEAQKTAKKNHPNVKIVTSINEIEDNIDAAIVVTPTSFHYQLVKDCLNKNWHVFCEKPLCENEQEADELIKLAKEKQVKVQVGHSERFHEAWQTIKDSKILSAKQPLIKIDRRATFKGRATDVDVVQDLMVHDLDILCFVLNRKPTSVKASGFKTRTDNWDHVHAVFQLENGGVAEICVGRNYVFEKRTVELMNEKGCLYIDLFKNEIHYAPNDQVADGIYTSFEKYQKKDHLLEEQKLFYRAILDDTDPVVTIEEGARIVSLIDKVRESLEQNKELKL